MFKTNILRTFQSMLQHPLGKEQKLATIIRFIRWQLGSRLLGTAAVVPFIGCTRLLMKTGDRGATMNFYVGLHEFEEMAFLLHMLQSGEMFIDVGANIGTYTILAAGVRRARVIAIEPIPATYEALIDNINLNYLSQLVITHNIGLAGGQGRLQFSINLGPTNHVTKYADCASTINIDVKTLNDIAADFCPSLIKIDVEGFEQEVIRGGNNTLSKPSLLALIVELNGLGNRYGFKDGETDKFIRKFGFIPVSYDPFARRFYTRRKPGLSGNILYIRPEAELSYRLKNAGKIEVNGIRF